MRRSTRIMTQVAFLIGIFMVTTVACARVAEDGRVYDVLKYELALKLRPDLPGISGTGSVTFVTTSTTSQVRFDASSRTMTIDSVTGRGANLPFSHFADELSITLPRIHPASDTETVVIHYRAVAAFDGRYDSGGVYFTSDSGRIRVGTISEPNFAREWWPCNDRPSDKALVRLTCSVPRGMTAVSNGRQAPVITEGEWRTFSWETGYPIATYLVFLGAAEYTVTSDTMRTTDGGTLDILTYVFPEDSVKAAADFLNIKSILGYFSETFGPYPFMDDKFAIAEVEGRLTMENQTVVAFENDLITGDRQNENTLVHETAHQWWGNLVTPASWNDIWLAEAFATLSEALYIESRRGPDIYMQYVDVLMNQPPGYYDGPVVVRDSGTFWEAFSPAVYYKGALVLHMLRRMVGDTVFFTSLREYLDGPTRRYGNATTGDFIGVCESTFGSKLDWFFGQWLQPPSGAADRPAVVYQWTTTKTAEGADLALEIRQEQEGALVYRLPFTVLIHAGGAVDSFSVIDSTRHQIFYRSVGAMVDSVIIDPERDIFMSLTQGESP